MQVWSQPSYREQQVKAVASPVSSRAREPEARGKAVRYRDNGGKGRNNWQKLSSEIYMHGAGVFKRESERGCEHTQAHIHSNAGKLNTFM